MLVIIVTVDGEDTARRVFRRAQNCTNSEGRERKIKEISKNCNNNILLTNFPKKIIN